MKKFHYTAIIEKGDSVYYVGQIKEVPEAISQGKTIDELKANLLDALLMILKEKIIIEIEMLDKSQTF